MRLDTIIHRGCWSSSKPAGVCDCCVRTCVWLFESLLISEAHCVKVQQGDKMSSEPGWGRGAKHLLSNSEPSLEAKDKAASPAHTRTCASTATLLQSCQSPLDLGCEDPHCTSLVTWGDRVRGSACWRWSAGRSVAAVLAAGVGLPSFPEESPQTCHWPFEKYLFKQHKKKLRKPCAFGEYFWMC